MQNDIFPHVVLVDEQDNVIGIKNKIEAHNENTSLHRGFSVFLFNKGFDMTLWVLPKINNFFYSYTIHLIRRSIICIFFNLSFPLFLNLHIIF